MRKIALLAIVLLVLCATGLTVLLSQSVAWVGRRSLPVVVSVFDAETGQPISQAEVIVFKGPQTPVEAPRLEAPIEAKVGSSDSKHLTTDERGECEFEYPFPAAGTEWLFGNSGYIVVSGVWLRVTAPDGRRVFVALDRQSAAPSDQIDRSPIFVTVVLVRQVEP